MSPAPETPATEPAPERATETVTPADLEALAAQLGRMPRGVVAIAAPPSRPATTSPTRPP